MSEPLNVPIEFQIWTAADCAAYQHITKEHFLRVGRYEENFPKQLAMSDAKRPRWAAKAIIEWALDRKIPDTM